MLEEARLLHSGTFLKLSNADVCGGLCTRKKKCHTKMQPCLKVKQLRPAYLDQVKDDDRRAEALQHLVKVETGNVGIRVGLIHWKRQ